MTNEEAIKKLKSFCHNCSKYPQCVNTDRECFEALDMAIRALKNEQSEQNVGMCQPNVEEMSEKQTGGDLISRTDLLNAIWQKEYGKDYDGVNMLDIPHIDIIENMPSAEKTAEQDSKTGYWITKDGKEQGYDIGGVKTWYIQIMCNKCGFIKTAIEGHTGQYHYCPNCGAKMKEVE